MKPEPFSRSPLRRSFVPFLAALLGVLAGVWIGIQFVAPAARDARGTNEEFDFRVRDYLLRNPDVLIDVMRALEARASDEETGDLATALEESSQDIADDPAAPVGGNPEGDVSLVEFFDYNCPYCRLMLPIVRQLMENDPGLRIVFKEWPILGPGSEFAAKAALAANMQGKYLPFHEALMAGPGQANESRALEVAKELGLDLEQLRRDMESDEVAQALERNFAQARALRITGTPAFVVGSEIVRGAVDSTVLEGLIASARSADPSPE